MIFIGSFEAISRGYPHFSGRRRDRRITRNDRLTISRRVTEANRLANANVSPSQIASFFIRFFLHGLFNGFTGGLSIERIDADDLDLFEEEEQL